MKKYAIIVAGGTGQRMDSEIPKQFMLLGGKPVLLYSLLAFHSSFDDIELIVVLPKDFIPVWNNLCSIYQININHRVFEGGHTRFESVKNGLSNIDLSIDGIVAIHDAARPLLKASLIKKLFNVAESSGNAIPVLKPDESLREINETDNKPIKRNNIRIVQTPQCFKTSQLNMLYSQEYRHEFTDDATVVETKGIKINLVEGDKNNIKITTKEDIIVAEALLNNFHFTNI